MAKPIYSLIVPFSRGWCVRPFFEHFATLKLDKPNTELIFYVDTDQPLYEMVIAAARELKGFYQIKVVNGKNGEKAHFVKDCRVRIATVHEKIKPYVEGKYILALEDDTLCPANSFYDLAKYFADDEQMGFIQGVEVGRRGYRVFGSWQCYENSKLIHVESDEPKTQLQPISGGGLYCFMCRADLYKAHSFASFADSKFELLGPDFYFVYSIKKKGFGCFTNWNLRCRHLYFEGMIKEILYNDANLVAIYKLKEGSEKWEHTTRSI